MDYDEHIKKGLEAAQEAFDAQKEIETIFEDLNKALSAYNIRISIVERTEKTINEYLATLNNPFAQKKYKKYIAASKENKERTLAIWTQDSKGYPCTLSYDNNTYSCHNKEALEKNLASMMANTIVGEKIFHLINDKTE